jgi:hypothetical protein
LTHRLRLAGAIALAVAAWAAEPAAAANNLGPSLEVAAGNGAQTITGDFNGDGNLDVASAGVNVRSGNGAGGFTATPFSTGALIPVGIAAGDFNEDTRPDIVSTGFPAGASVLLSNASGGFGAAQTVTGSQTGGVATGDFDGDTNVDIAVNSSGVVRVFRGDGAGGFAAGIDFPGGSGAGPLAAADLDGNGRDDLVAGDLAADTVDVLLAKSGPLTTGPGGLEIFDAAVSYATAADPQRVLVTDLDGDGARDVVVNAANLQALYGNGAGAFGTAVTVATGPVADVSTGTFDGDAITDLAIGRATGLVSIVLGRSDRLATVGRSFASGFSSGLGRVATGDFNEDSLLDVVADATAGSRLLPGETIRVLNPSLTYPDARVGASDVLTVTFRNTDAIPHTFTGGQILSAGAFDVALGDDGCTGTTLPPDGLCQVAVTFSASSPGVATGVLAMDTDAGDSPHTATLSGEAFPVPALEVLRDLTPFATMKVGVASRERLFVVHNPGDLPLQVEPPVLAGDDPGAFVLRDNCGYKLLAAHQSCSSFVSFKPTHAGVNRATLRFPNDGLNPSHSVSLTGTGDATPAPEFTLTPASLGFGRVRLGASTTKVVELSNTGAVAFSLGSLRVAPSGNGFTARQEGCLDGPILPKAGCRITVRFRPKREGGHEADVSFTGLTGARLTAKGVGFELIQQKGPLTERLAAAVDVWRDKGIEGLSKRGARLSALEVVLPGKAGLEVSMRRKGAKVVLAQGLVRYAAAGTASVVAKPTKRGRALLKKLDKVTLRARLRFRAANGRLTEVNRTVVLRRLERQAFLASCSASPARNLPSASPPPRSGCSRTG